MAVLAPIKSDARKVAGNGENRRRLLRNKENALALEGRLFCSLAIDGQRYVPRENEDWVSLHGCRHVRESLQLRICCRIDEDNVVAVPRHLQSKVRHLHAEIGAKDRSGGGGGANEDLVRQSVGVELRDLEKQC